MTLLQHVPLSALNIEDEADYASIPLYAPLRDGLLAADACYRVAGAGSPVSRWDQVLLLNLAFWSPGEPDDVLEGRYLSADMVAHRAWHHLAHAQLGPAARSVEGLMFGESIASAFDIYVVGTLLRTCPGAVVLETQVPAMSEALAQAGLDEAAIEAFFTRCTAQPTKAFTQLRTLLFETGVALAGADGAEAAAEVLERAAAHPMGPLLHHFEFATWTLYARAHAQGDGATALALHRELAQAGDGLAWLATRFGLSV